MSTPAPWSIEEEATEVLVRGPRNPASQGSRVVLRVKKNRTGASRGCAVRWYGPDKAVKDDLDHLVRAVNTAAVLLAAAKDAQCSCSLRERDSGHLIDCWMPALIDAIALAEGRA